MSLPLTRPGALLIAARRPDPGNGRLIAAVSVGDPAAARRAGERLERCDGLIFVITVPSTFRAMLRGSHERRAWLDSLPERVDRQCRAWNLSLDGDPWHGSNALVLPVRRGGEQFALRLTAPDESFPAEVAALRFWAGRGTVLLVETDLGAGTMLLERLDPTRSLATLPLAEANHHAGRMMRRLAVPAPSWVLSTGELVRDRLATLKSDWAALGRPVPAGMLAAACTAAETLTSATGDRAVDAALHHEQVLGGSGNLGSPSIPACCAATSGSTSPAACGTGSTRCPTPRRSTSSWTSSPTLRASTGNTLAAQRSSAPSTTGCGVSSTDSPRIPSAAGVSSPRCFSDPPFTPTGDHAWQ